DLRGEGRGLQRAGRPARVLEMTIDGVAARVGPEAVVVTAERALSVLSTAVVGGGFARARAVLNVHVPKNFACADAEGTVAAAARRLGVPAPWVALLTGARTERAEIATAAADDVRALVVVTVGLSNPSAAGPAGAGAGRGPLARGARVVAPGAACIPPGGPPPGRARSVIRPARWLPLSLAVHAAALGGGLWLAREPGERALFVDMTRLESETDSARAGSAPAKRAAAPPAPTRRAPVKRTAPPARSVDASTPATTPAPAPAPAVAAAPPAAPTPSVAGPAPAVEAPSSPSAADPVVASGAPVAPEIAAPA